MKNGYSLRARSSLGTVPNFSLPHFKYGEALACSHQQLPGLRIMKGDVDNHHENRYEDASLQQVAFLKLEAPEINCQKHI